MQENRNNERFIPSKNNNSPLLSTSFNIEYKPPTYFTQSLKETDEDISIKSSNNMTSKL